MNLVIVESAAKAKAINKYLGPSFKVLASYGHVRDLPSKDGSVEPDNDFAMHWSSDDDRSKKVMREISEAVKKADKLILATDPDREGEAISWHILELLTEKKALRKGTPVERVTFNAVTKQSVLDAMKAPRQIDVPLVDAYLWIKQPGTSDGTSSTTRVSGPPSCLHSTAFMMEPCSRSCGDRHRMALFRPAASAADVHAPS